MEAVRKANSHRAVNMVGPTYRPKSQFRAGTIVRSRPIRHFKAYSAVSKWKRYLHPVMTYTIGYLAKHPDEDPGTGFRFAREAMAVVVPAGGRLCTMARTSRHIRANRAAGFRQLPFKGQLTEGMAGMTPAAARRDSQPEGTDPCRGWRGVL